MAKQWKSRSEKKNDRHTKGYLSQQANSRQVALRFIFSKTRKRDVAFIYGI